MFRVANRADYEKCLAVVVPLMGADCEVDEGRPYWKMPELWECQITMPSVGGTLAEQVLSGLLKAQSLASGWYVLGSLTEHDANGFSGVFSANQSGSFSHVPGLEWASFDFA
ncbi:MAG: hypothetical protein SH850_15370 [Planctomycetaceae bacterium]|nr:hypothetical protein [Planctomycetaceae bacterium]